MLLEALHAGLIQNFKGQFCLFSVSLLAPAFMTLCRQRRGQRSLKKSTANRLFSAIKWSQGLTFCWIHFKEETFFVDLVPIRDLLYFGKFPAGEFSGSSNLRKHIIRNDTEWRLESKAVFLPMQEVWATPSADTKRKNKQTKQNKTQETKTNIEVYVPQFRILYFKAQ